MTQTDYLGLPLTLDSDDQMTFLEWRRRIDGGDDSDMVKIDSAIKSMNTSIETKQNKLAGSQGQVVGFAADGSPIAQDAPDIGVESFNGRNGIVIPMSGDYTAEMVGADIAGAANNVQENLSAHEDNTGIHVTDGMKTLWNSKQDALTFDAAPTSGSVNPVTSGGIYSYVLSEIESAVGVALGGSY